MANIFDDMPTSSAAEPAAPPPGGEGGGPEPKQNIFDNLGKAPEQIGVAESLPPVSNFESSKAGRFIQGLAEPIAGAGQLAAHLTGVGPETMDRFVKDREAQYQASRKAAGIRPQDWDYWAGAGNVLSPMNFLPGAVVGRSLGPAATLMGNVSRGAVTGATMGAFEPVGDTSKGNFAEKKATQVGAGAIGGGLTAPLAHMISETLAPQIEPGMRRLIAEGATPTIGQVYGPGSTIGRLEEAVSKWPLIGGYVQAARERALESFNDLVASRALRPINVRLPRDLPTGYDKAEFVADELGHTYDQVHQYMTLQPSHPLNTAVNRIYQLGQETLPENLQNQLQRIGRNQLINKPVNAVSRHGAGIMDGRGVQDMHSVLANYERGYLKSPDVDVRNLGVLVGELRNALNDELDRQNPLAFPPGTHLNGTLLPTGTTLNDVRRMADEGWAHYVRMREAAASTASMAREGTFTPNTYAQSIRKAARSSSQLAQNHAMDQQLAVDAQRFLRANMADSGTPERAMWAALLAGGATINPQMAVIGAIIPGLYSQRAQSVLRHMAMAQHPAPVRAAAQTIGGIGAGVGAEGALSTLDETPRQYADGGDVGDFGQEGLEALGRVPHDLKQYARDLPEADTTDKPSLVSRGVDAANYGINALVEGLSGGRTSTPKMLGAIGLPTGELEERLHGFEARNRPALQVGRDVGAAGLGMIGVGGLSRAGSEGPNILARSVAPGGLADRAAGSFERGAAEAGNPYRLNAGIPGKGALTPEQEALLAKFKRPEPATPDEISSLEPKARAPLTDGNAPKDGAAEPLEAKTARGNTLVPSSDFGPGTAVRFVHPDSHLAQSYENELISGKELFARTKQAISGVKAIAEKLASKGGPDRMSVPEFQEWAAQRHNPFSTDPREARMKFSIQDAEDAGYAHAYTEGGQEFVELTPLGRKAIERFKKSGM